MEELMQAMVKALSAAGLHTEAGLPNTVMPRLSQPCATVSPAEASCPDAGVYRYLGLTESGGNELYGRRLEAVLCVELFSPKKDGGAGIRKAVGQVMEVLLGGIPTLTIGEISVGGCSYNAACDCFVCAVHVPVSAFVYAVASDDGTAFSDFILKGEAK